MMIYHNVTLFSSSGGEGIRQTGKRCTGRRIWVGLICDGPPGWRDEAEMELVKGTTPQTQSAVRENLETSVSGKGGRCKPYGSTRLGRPYTARRP
jgi:hypothetical protein